MKHIKLIICLLVFNVALGQKSLDQLVNEVDPKVIELRRDFHQFPELSNREFKTSQKIASYLEGLGIKVITNVAHTGVIGILEGDGEGPVVALRADMDALPVTERVDLPFASKEISEYNGVSSGVMHACGHDTHVAMLLGAAEILSKMKADLKGTVKFIFQPAEEGVPPGEEGGAKLMVEVGALKNPDVDVIFGIHIDAFIEVGKIGYKPGGIMAEAQRFEIEVQGKQSHGASPWSGVDPIVISAQIINGLQTIISRDTELTKEAAVITVGMIQGGLRYNIIPENVKMIGTIRTLDEEMKLKINSLMEKRVKSISQAFGGDATIEFSTTAPLTYNHLELTSYAVPVLNENIGDENVMIIDAITGAEDFSYFQKEVPGFYFFVGGRNPNVEIDKIADHHTPDFYIDEAGMKTGVRSFVSLTLDYLNNAE
ncbi:amidohydrolase [Urechidicola vernalis]|uniref:Amidohydrolase n=1 Tax=Urechidicola vernalis TaxID=3075600 RepID=A0ABU2Y669_9FLAO|nr:amidohydrolase [Urechidicola sp. P050]MDT0553301.1 amidohydrolase [Urechidicola sp. P050]